MRVPWWKMLAWNAVILLVLPAFLLAAVLPGRRTLLVWGSTPLLANKYWSEAMRKGGHASRTIMAAWYDINRRDDFDAYFEDFAPSFLPRSIRHALGACRALIFALRQARVVHTSYFGFALNLSSFWRLESLLFRMAGVKTIILPFGADAYLYSQVIDTSLRYGLLASYPEHARLERSTRAKVEHWNAHADAVLAGLMVDGIGRWDVTLNQYFVIDTEVWLPKRQWSSATGGPGAPVRILHTPNHRGFKGTEFIVDAVERLRAEGLNVELVLLEKVSNEVVRTTMAEVDILAEQILATGYAMSGIEGMASGLPVLSNLQHEAYTRVFRRFGFLDECPILSTTPETIFENLRVLVKNPALREELGRAGRAYVAKYHSYEFGRFLFESIYDKLFGRRDVDLLKLFHPLMSEYNRRSPRVAHPLKDSLLPKDWMPTNA